MQPEDYEDAGDEPEEWECCVCGLPTTFNNLYCGDSCEAAVETDSVRFDWGWYEAVTERPIRLGIPYAPNPFHIPSEDELTKEKK